MLATERGGLDDIQKFTEYISDIIYVESVDNSITRTPHNIQYIKYTIHVDSNIHKNEVLTILHTKIPSDVDAWVIDSDIPNQLIIGVEGINPNPDIYEPL